MRGLLGILAAVTIGASACDDPLSPEERWRLMQAAFTADDAFWWGELGEHGVPGPVTLDMLPTADIVVEVDDEWVTYRAFVIERRHVPDTGHFGSLSRQRRFLIAWRLDDPRQMFWMGGGRLPGPMGPRAIENEPDEWLFYRPHLFMRLVTDSFMENRRGRAELEPAGALGACGFPWSNPATSEGPTAFWTPLCERWSYRVAFDAELGKAWNTREGRLTIRMLPQLVPGFRLTGECDGSIYAQGFGCGEFIAADDPCVPLNPTPPREYCAARGRPVAPDTSDTRPR